MNLEIFEDQVLCSRVEPLMYFVGKYSPMRFIQIVLELNKIYIGDDVLLAYKGRSKIKKILTRFTDKQLPKTLMEQFMSQLNEICYNLMIKKV